MRAPLVVAVVWLALGLVAGLERPVPPGGGPLLVFVALAGAAAALVLAGERTLPILFLLAGALLGSTVRASADASCLRRLPDERPLEVVGRVLQAGAGSLRLRVDSLAVGGVWVECGSELPARWAGVAEVAVGDGVRGEGRWWSPPGARSTLGRPGTLLLDTLVADHGAAATMAPESSPVRARGPPGARIREAGARIREAGARFREAGVERIEAVFPRHAGLVASLLLARRDGLDRDVRDRYARAGLSHLLAISGLHVGLIAGILLLLAGTLRLEKGRASTLAAAGTVGYVALLGAPDSASRAALQIILVLAAAAVQRPARTESIIAAAALVLLVLDPGAITRPGFQLSFAGVAGILMLRQPILQRLHRLAEWRVAGRGAGRWLADGLATSLAATLVTAPIVAWHFGRVAPVGIVANVVAIPLLGAAVPALALALVVGTVWLPAGRFLAGGAGLLMDALDHTATVAASVPFGTVAVQPMAALVMAGAVTAGYVGSRRLGRVRRGVRFTVWAAVAGAVLLVAPLRPTGDRVEIHVVDVGQGDAIALRSPAGRWLLVDAGVAGAGYDAGASRVVPYLAARGVSRLDALVITHPDADHMGGAAAVVRSLRPRWAGGPALAVGKASTWRSSGRAGRRAYPGSASGTGWSWTWTACGWPSSIPTAPGWPWKTRTMPVWSCGSCTGSSRRC